MTKRAYLYRFYPTDEQARNLAQTFGCTRFVYNWALDRSASVLTSMRGSGSPPKTFQPRLLLLKKEEGTNFLKEVSSVPLQQALRASG